MALETHWLVGPSAVCGTVRPNPRTNMDGSEGAALTAAWGHASVTGISSWSRKNIA